MKGLVGSRSKMYSYLKDSTDEKKDAKAQKSVS